MTYRAPLNFRPGHVFGNDGGVGAIAASFLLGYNASPWKVKNAVTYADAYSTASLSGDAPDAPLYVPERSALYAPRGDGTVGKFTSSAYSSIAAQSGVVSARGIGRVGPVLLAQWIISFGSNPMARSLDFGDTWVPFVGPLATGGQAYAVDMCASATQFVTVGTLLTAGAPTFARSPDGITWFTASLPDAANLGQAYYVLAIGSTVVCVGTMNPGNTTLRVHVSVDGGISWANAATLHGTLTSLPLNLFKAGGYFYLSVNSGTYWYSANGSTWSAVPVPPTGSISGLLGGVSSEMWFNTSSGIRSYSPVNGWSALISIPAGYFYSGVFV